MSQKERKALVEIGSNSVKYLVAEKDESGSVTCLVDRNQITRIAQGLTETGGLQEKAMARTLSSISEFMKELSSWGVDRPTVVGTMAIRAATNSQEFAELVETCTGSPLHILSGDEEGFYSFLGAQAIIPENAQGWLFDTGGGSTEFILFRGQERLRTLSLNVGAVILTEKRLSGDLVSQEQVDQAVGWIRTILIGNDICTPVTSSLVIGVGGNVTTVASVAGVEGDLPLAAVEEQIQLYRKTPLEARRDIPGIVPGRAEIILAGACILRAICETLEVDLIKVSPSGLRHGVMGVLLNEEIFR